MAFSVQVGYIMHLKIIKIIVFAERVDMTERVTNTTFCECKQWRKLERVANGYPSTMPQLLVICYLYCNDIPVQFAFIHQGVDQCRNYQHGPAEKNSNIKNTHSYP